MTSESGFVWSMNCDSCELPKYSFTTAETGFALMRSCGMSVSISCDMRHALFDRALHADQTDAVLVLHELADRANAAVTEVIDIVDHAAAVTQLDQVADGLEDVALREDLRLDRFVDLELVVRASGDRRATGRSARR